MSFVIWYKVEISDDSDGGGLLGTLSALAGSGLPVTISNDMLNGAFILDADITVTMREEAAADTFDVKLINLPTRVTELIRAAQAARPLRMTVRLGYFDEPETTSTDIGVVLVGRVTKVASGVGTDGLAVTVLSGQEEAGWRLRNVEALIGPPSDTPALQYMSDLVGIADLELAAGSSMPGTLPAVTTRFSTLLAALRELTKPQQVPLLVRDGKVFLGDAVGALSDRAPVAFDPDVNIVELEAVDGEDTALQLKPPVRSTLNLTVLGHPQLRVGQIATVKGLSGLPDGPLRLSRVVHCFKSTQGYTTEVSLIVAQPGVRVQATDGVRAVVDRLANTVDRSRDDHPAIDVGEVAEYAPGADGSHLATMHYGQTPEPGVVSPSVASEVDSTVDLVSKPIASVFAFANTGLMVPVYPKMRALLAHNQGRVNDAVVTGFLWPDNPRLDPPPNEAGDYWLALPTELDNDGLPQNKGVNDLTDKGGFRVIQAAGLHILVGADKLPDVGTRPDPPTDASITIEHHSGTTITIDAGGAVTITTSNKTIELTNGSVNLKLDGSNVAVS
ncbi:hypothetical protein [Dactylosporangium sp. CA-092794]|uniref:hypothetical protein n=1 Tax=Dactylosporangium sp. CA-092794 TaxID=3239929 RepID=UPI003D8DAB49